MTRARGKLVEIMAEEWEPRHHAAQIYACSHLPAKAILGSLLWAEDDGSDLRCTQRCAGHAQVAVHRLLCSNSGSSGNSSDQGRRGVAWEAGRQAASSQRP